MHPSILIAFCLTFTLQQAPQVDRYQLENGVRVLSVHVAEAPKQTTLTFLPLSLASDPANRAQWSHLIEHMLIRATDPAGLVAEGIEVNGETGAEYLRLDSYAEPGHWRASIERHVKWIAARDFDAATLEREKKMIELEIQNTAAAGYTHKWAIAAWNQIVRHGLNHAALRGDIENADLEEVEAATRTLVPVNETVLIASIGPADPEELKAAITETIGALSRSAAERDQEGEAGKATKSDHSGTWDLPTKHLILWWKLPDDTLATRAAARAFGTVIGMQLWQQYQGGEARIIPLVHSEVPTPEGLCFIVNVSMSADADDETIRTTTLARAARIAESPGAVTQTGRAVAQGMALPSDFSTFRRQAPAHMAQYLEGNILLQAAIIEFSCGEPFETYVEHLRSIDAKSATALAELIKGPPTGTLILNPPSPP